MWTRAAVALKNINICEMPSHDGDLGTGRRAGCGRACLTTACVPLAVRAAGLQPFIQGVHGSCVSRPGSSLVFHGCQPWRPQQGSVGIEGQVLCSSLNMANRTHVAACPVSQHRNVVDMFDPCPAPLLITCGPSLVCISQSESKGMYIACVPQLHSPSCKVHVGSACVLSWGFCSFWRPRARQAEGEVGVGGAVVQSISNSGGGRNLGPPPGA